MSTRKVRLSELGKVNPIGAVDHRRFKSENGTPCFFEQLPRKEKRRLAAEGQRIGKEYKKIMDQTYQSGAKFPTDKLLREMAGEYNNRFASSGIYTQPTSFNYFEPFLQVKLIRQAAPYVKVGDEFNHVFHAEDYFEYVTSNISDGFDVIALMELPQNQVFHFSTSGLVTDFAFQGGGGRDFVIAGFSMIRHGDSLHWYLVGGESYSGEEWAIKSAEQPEYELSQISPEKRAFLRDVIADRGLQRGRPRSLEGTDFHLRTIIAGEFDIKEKKHLSRCYMGEYKNSFDVLCDDPEIFSKITDKNIRAGALESMVQRFSDTAVLWSLAEGLFQLPNYFSVRLSINEEVVSASRKKHYKKKGGQGLAGEYVVVPALEIQRSGPSSSIMRVNLPQYEIETEGHWKRIPEDQSGTDRHGNSVVGRTWVAASSKWKANCTNVPTIFLKDTLRSAKVKIQQYLEAAKRVAESSLSQDEVPSSDCGELYILRCSAMSDQIYKVGFTQGCSLKRAQQLSSATGVPLAFVVEKKWKHKDARRLETEVHMLLAAYRINDAREFFQIGFDKLKKVVEGVIDRNS